MTPLKVGFGIARADKECAHWSLSFSRLPMPQRVYSEQFRSADPFGRVKGWRKRHPTSDGSTPPETVLTAVALKIDVHFHPHRERIHLRQIDQNFDHIDVSHVALPPRVDASFLDNRRAEGDLTREFASGKGGGAY